MVGYLALIVLYLWAWRLAPTWAFGGFLVATVVHWGHGDLRYLEDLHRRYDVGLRGSIAAIALRGAIPIVVPVLAHPHEAESLLQHAARVLGSGVVSIDLSSTTVRVVGWTALALAAAAYAWTSRRAWPSRRGAWIDACEVVGLATFFVIVPAYLAVGAYFMGWHALRHLARLVLLQPRDVRALARGDHLRPALRLARDLVPMTGLAAAMLVGLYLWARPHVVGTEGFVALYLVWISALTKPHLLVVAAMDLAPGTRERAGWAHSSA
jgi:Brp/Blh family beta-carotene 15,15'-monooxygenase